MENKNKKKRPCFFLTEWGCLKSKCICKKKERNKNARRV